MKSSTLMKNLYQKIKERDKGFSLIELVFVITVLAIFSAIAIPKYICFQRKAKATAALVSMKQIQNECEVNKSINSNSSTFSPTNLNSYQIQSDGSNSCNGLSSTGLITAIPSDTNILPTFILAANTDELTYEFKGSKGKRISDCLPLICGTSTFVHDPDLDPIHGSKCTGFRTSMVHHRPEKRVVTGCYGEPEPGNSNGWHPDPCAFSRFGCESTSFYTRHGYFPCIAGEDKFNFKVAEGFPPTTSRNCKSFNPDPPPRNCYCFPPRENCTCD